jgi:hypothetical protein
MKMDKVANSGNDEFYTPKYAVKPILEFIEPKSTIWCPFDTEQSNFVKLLKEEGHSVINTHLDMGIDFFEYEPKEYDYIISNPPYSLKTEVLERLFSLKKPFAMLLGVAGLFESQRRFNMFANNKFEIMYLNLRVAYFKNYDDQKPSLNPPFSSVYITHNMLPEQIVFRKIDKKDI